MQNVVITESTLCRVYSYVATFLTRDCNPRGELASLEFKKAKSAVLVDFLLHTGESDRRFALYSIENHVIRGAELDRPRFLEVGDGFRVEADEIVRRYPEHVYASNLPTAVKSFYI